MGTGTNSKELSILGILGPIDSIGAVQAYRITSPFMHLNNNTTARCAWMPSTAAVTHMAIGEEWMVFNHDIIVLQRLLTDDEDAAAALVASLRVRGARVVYEADDDFTEPHPRERGTCLPFIRYVDAITASTPYLARKMSNASGGKPAYHLPNCIEFNWFSDVSLQAKRRFNELTVMLVGTPTHYDDWMVMAEVVPRILARHSHVRFLVGGYLPGYLEGENVTFLPPVGYREYPAMLRQADIVCAPLDPSSEFNRSKSAVKALEAWSAARKVGRNHVGGAAVVATNCPTYRRLVQNRHNGLLVEHTPDAWVAALSRLIEDDFLRQKLQVEGLKDAKKRDIARNWRLWYRTYLRIAGGET